MKYEEMSISELLRQDGFECACGKRHYAGVEQVYIEENAILRLPEILKKLGVKKPFLLSDVNTWKAAGEKVASALSGAGYAFSGFSFQEAHVEPDAQDEIGILIQEFNEMVSRVNELVQAVEAKQILLKEAEIKALQQQINPHFMSNIMETIMGLASEGMDDEVIRVSECMSDMLRYNTRFENTTTLREELEQVRNYVSVLQIRFEDRFEAYYDVDEECMDCRMVKFTLQPLVENAISHGLSQTEKDGMIRIRVKREGSQISIMIFDNGIGMTNEMRDELIKRLTQTAERPLEYINQYKSLGILNVHLRLRMYYGEAYSIELFSKEGRGTCFSIKIPFMQNSVEETHV